MCTEKGNRTHKAYCPLFQLPIPRQTRPCVRQTEPRCPVAERAMDAGVTVVYETEQHVSWPLRTTGEVGGWWTDLGSDVSWLEPCFPCGLPARGQFPLRVSAWPSVPRDTAGRPTPRGAASSQEVTPGQGSAPRPREEAAGKSWLSSDLVLVPCALNSALRRCS